MLKITVYHNDRCRFTSYEPGQPLIAIASHWLAGDTADPHMLADWAFRTFNADLDTLQAQRDTGDGEIAFLAACVYRLLGYRSLSVGDVVEVATETDHQFLACESVGWRRIAAPANVTGQPLSAATVYRHITGRPTTR